MGAGPHRVGTELVAPQNLQQVEREEQRAGAQPRWAPGKERGSPRGPGRAAGEGLRGAREANGQPAPLRRGREPGRSWGGRRAHPQGGQVDVVQAAGGGWVAHGLRGEWGPGAAHAPARLFRCRRRHFSPIGGSWGRTPPAKGRAGGRTDPRADRSLRPGACNPSRPTLLRRRGVAARREGGRENVTRARRVPLPLGAGTCAQAQRR